MATCNGDLRYLLSGQHSPLTSTALAADFDSLLQVTNPSDIYTLVDFDGHTDHAEVARQTAAAVRRLDGSARPRDGRAPARLRGLHGLLGRHVAEPRAAEQHPLSRFTPTIPFSAPPTPTCSAPTSFGWGPLGPPTESVDVPAEMQLTNPQQNLKWRSLNVWASQCPPDDPANVTCGYFNAFAKKNEFFWTQDFGPRVWPATYTADWTSTATIADRAQRVDGEWTYDAARDGVRPLATGFDRLLAIGQFDWRSYEVTVPVTMNWFDPTKAPPASASSSAGRATRPTSASSRARGTPTAGSAASGAPVGGAATPRADPQRGRRRGHDPGRGEPAAHGDAGVQYTMRFRRVDLGNGSSRYSCKLWRTRRRSRRLGPHHRPAGSARNDPVPRLGAADGAQHGRDVRRVQVTPARRPHVGAARASVPRPMRGSEGRC